jgi:hypothetical protein
MEKPMNTYEVVREANSYKPYSCRPISVRLLFGFRMTNGYAIEFEQCEIMLVNFRSDAEEITRLLNVAYAEGRLQELKQELMA